MLSFISQLRRLDVVTVQADDSSIARLANHILLCGLVLFAISVPHSIAAAQISLGICLIAWIARDLAMRRFHFTRTPIDLPLLCFATLTIISSITSVEPSLSMPRLKTLILFSVIYVIATNLRPRGVWLLAGLLIVSSLVGVGFSLTEKLLGRGMVVKAIEPDSPIAGSQLQPGDVIWMIARHRVFTPEGAAHVIRKRRPGEILEVEALHAGDPVPVKLKVTEELKTRANPLGISTNGRSRQFRVSGFIRQFQTYAEQMQLFALLAYGGLLTGVRLWKERSMRGWFKIFGLFFALFSTALVLTASRAVILSFLITLILISFSVGGSTRGRLAPLVALFIALLLGGLSLYVITSARQRVTLNFDDDSSLRRLGYMQAGLRMIPQHPLLGVGIDSHKRHWREWGFPGDYITHTHSTPIQIAMDRGLPALSCYLWLTVILFMLTWRGYRQTILAGDGLSAGLMLGSLAVLIGFSLSSLVNYNFGDSEILMLLLFIIGLVIVTMRHSTLKDPSQPYYERLTLKRSHVSVQPQSWIGSL
jgi:O-Antigen ligase/PDZ domain